MKEKSNIKLCLVFIQHHPAARTVAVLLGKDSSKSLNSTGGLSAILPKDIPSFGILKILVESAVEHISPKSHIDFQQVVMNQSVSTCAFCGSICSFIQADFILSCFFHSGLWCHYSLHHNSTIQSYLFLAFTCTCPCGGQ